MSTTSDDGFITLDDSSYLSCFDNVNWTAINKKHFISFRDELEKDETIMSLIDEVYEHERHGKGPHIDVQNIVNDLNYHNCNDRSFGFFLPCHNTASKTYHSQIFHISLHSREPNYNETTGVCEFIKCRTDDYESCGAFHYKIDRIVPIANFAISSKHYTGNPSSSKDNCKKADHHNILIKKPFKIFIHDHNCNFTPNNFDFSISHILSPNCHELHKLIYNKFVSYWNSTILPSVINVAATPAPQPTAPTQQPITDSLVLNEILKALGFDIKLKAKERNALKKKISEISQKLNEKQLAMVDAWIRKGGMSRNNRLQKKSKNTNVIYKKKSKKKN